MLLELSFYFVYVNGFLVGSYNVMFLVLFDYFYCFYVECFGYDF